MNIEGFLYVLPYIGQGMLGVFIVCGVIILAITAMNKLTSPKSK